MDYLLHITIMIGIYAIICMAANLLTGLTNHLSLGFAAFYGIGAYITALCVLYLGWAVLPSLLLIMLINGILALAVALPSLRLKGDYFVLATLGFQVIVYNLLYNWTKLTNGPSGIGGISDPVIIGSVKLTGINSFLIFTLVLCVLTGVIFFRL